MKVLSRGNVFQFALLLVGILVLVAGCRKEEKIELEAFRLPPQEAVAEEAEASSQVPLFRIESDSPTGLMTRIEPLLPVLLPPQWMDQMPGFSEELRRFDALALTLWQAEIVLPETGEGPVLKSLELVLSGRPFEEVSSTAVLEDAQRLAGFFGAVIPGEETTECRIEGDGFECSIVVGEVASSLAVSSSLPRLDGSLLRLSFGPAGALRMLERTFGAPAVWLVVPEEVGHWDRLELTLPADLDRIELSLETTDSVAVPILKQMFSKRGVSVEVPKEAAVIVLASFQNMDNLVSQLDESLGKKLGPGAMMRARKLLAFSWHTELLEVAEGYCGAIPGKKISLSDPLGSFVYFMEPKTDEYLQKRLNYIFAKKNYRVEDREFRTGETVWVAVRRGARKNRERMAWFRRGEAVFLGSTTNLQSVAESLFVPQWKEPDSLKLSLPEGEWLHAWIHVDGLAERLDLGELGGMGAGMALAVLKTIAEEAPLPVELSVLQERLVGGSDRLVVRVDNLFALGLSASKQLAPFLNLMNRRRDEQSTEGSLVPPTSAGN